MRPKSNYPPSWNPGYALPGNVQAEGVERRAFVTKWSPRGTYDSSVNPTGGYQQPAYVMAEGVGQGTFTTDWVNSGTYMGPKIPHWSNAQPNVSIGASGPASGGQYVKIKPGKLSGLSGVSAAPASGQHPYANYGAAAATQILSRVAQLPPKQRKPALQQILNTVDPTLWTKVKATAQRNISAGQPAPRALHAAIAQHFATGIGQEVVALGKGRSPRKKSLLGLGMYGSSPRSSGLGAVISSVATAALTGGAVTQQTWASTTVAGVPVADGQCTSDGVLVWFHGGWRVQTPGDPPCPSNVAVTSAQVISSGAQIYVGMFPFSTTPGSSLFAVPYVTQYASPGSLPTGALQYIAQTIQKSWAGKGWPASLQLTTQPIDQVAYATLHTPASLKATAATGGITVAPDCAPATKGQDAQGFQWSMTAAGNYYQICDWLNAFGLASGSVATTPWWPYNFAGWNTTGIVNGFDMPDDNHDPIQALFNFYNEASYQPTVNDIPFAKFNHPQTGAAWGMWLGFASPLGSPESYTQLQVGFAPMPSRSWLQSLLEYVFWLPGQFFIDATEVVAATLGAIGTVACAIMTQPGAIVAGQAAGKAVGGAGGAAAGAAGAAVAQAACGGSSAPPMVPPPTNYMLPLLLLGLGAVVLVSRRHKKSAPGGP